MVGRAQTLMIGMLIGAVGGCATSTPYQPYREEQSGGIHGGYSEQQLSSDHFRVRFHGNEFTTRERVEGYLLYRAAELTMKNGFEWFRVAHRQVDHEVRTYERVVPAPWLDRLHGDWSPHWRYQDRTGSWRSWHPEAGARFWADMIDIQTVESFEVSADIQMGRGRSTDGGPRPFDAASTIRNLQPTIVVPPH